MAKKRQSLKIKNKKSQSKSVVSKPMKGKVKLKNATGKSSTKNFLFSKRNPLKQKKKKSEIQKDTLTKNVFTHQNKKVVDELYSSQLDTKYEVDDWDMVEQDYENCHKPEEAPLSKYRLPIKTKGGIVPVIENVTEEEVEETDEEISDKEEEATDEHDIPKSITATELLVTQNKTIEAKKIQIGSLSASILEDPNEKIDNLRLLIQLLNDKEVRNYLVIKKLIIVSLVEVFKDLLPAYRLFENIDKSIKLKKETLKLNKYETTVLQYYKKFLLFLSQFSSVLITRRNGVTKSDDKKRLGELSINALCDLLIAHPYFNYGENIAQAIIPFLNHSKFSIREKVKVTCQNIFNEDQKGEITVKIVRIINQYLKKFSYRIHVSMIEVLLFLKIKEVNIDQELIQKLKQKRLKSHKGNILKLSKNEKKRSARVKEVEKSLMEAKAEENRQNKQKNVTEITKLIFGIFFKILKNSTNTKIVGICLKGIARFAHCINVEFYMDLINILGNLLKEDWLAYSEKQRCIQTIFAILCEQGEVLNLDPAAFYSIIYENLLTVHAGRNYSDFIVVVETLIYSLIKRDKKITHRRMASFLKRIVTLSLQVLHNGTLSCLFISNSLLQSTGAMDILLDLESSSGDGLYVPELKDPEHCNAASTALFELTLLSRHYHPTVAEYAKVIASGRASVSDNIPNILTRSTADEIFNIFDMSQMCFCPPVPVMKNITKKTKLRHFQYCDNQFINSCNGIVRRNKTSLSFTS